MPEEAEVPALASVHRRLESRAAVEDATTPAEENELAERVATAAAALVPPPLLYRCTTQLTVFYSIKMSAKEKLAELDVDDIVRVIDTQCALPRALTRPSGCRAGRLTAS
eukprot:SAG11_NODE_891_length_6685_cov_4.256909_4_plen_110_part_00